MVYDLALVAKDALSHSFYDHWSENVNVNSNGFDSHSNFQNLNGSSRISSLKNASLSVSGIYAHTHWHISDCCLMFSSC